MLEAAAARSQRQTQTADSHKLEHRKIRGRESAAIGEVENDPEYMEFIKSSSTLRPLPTEPENPRTALPLWDWSELSYTVPLSIGTPPQPLTALLSLSSSTLLVPSSTCISCLSSRVYTSANSRTHIYPRPDTVFTSSSRLFNSRGNLSQDTIHLSSPSIDIPHQIFGEATEMSRYLPWGSSSWDGMLGLAASGEMEILQNMISQNILDKNLFSLKLPRTRNDKGEILFGDVDHDLYLGELRSLPLLREKKGRWAVAAKSLSINDGEGLILGLAGGAAVFDTEFPFIGLPERYVRILDENLGMKNVGKGWGNIRSIDCDRRKMLHNITITLGGEQFVVSPWEFTVETEMEMGNGGSERRCVSAFVPNEQENGSDIVLGSAFLRAFYAVFDMDGGAVSCEYLHSSPLLPSRMRLTLHL
jgi:Eukaryotic aspartyl protease